MAIVTTTVTDTGSGVNGKSINVIMGITIGIAAGIVMRMVVIARQDIGKKASVEDSFGTAHDDINDMSHKFSKN
jgi:hypothetical protein